MREATMKQAQKSETLIKSVAISAAVSVAIVAGIYLFLIVNGIKALQYDSIIDMLLGTEWRPDSHPPRLGLFPMIVSTLYVTLIAVLTAFPISLLCATYLAEFAPKIIRRTLRPAIDMLAGIPSVVYGLFGILTLVPFAREYLGAPMGYSALVAGIIVAIMILPYMTSVMMEAIRAVPREYVEAALGVGATRWQVVRTVLWPAAKSGITAGGMLGTLRAMGETVAVALVAGAALMMPTSPLDPCRPLSAHILLQATVLPVGSPGYYALYLGGLVLMLMITGVIILAYHCRKRTSRVRVRKHKLHRARLNLNPVTVSKLMVGLMVASGTIAAAALVGITGYILANGIGALSWDILFGPVNIGDPVHSSLYPALLGTLALMFYSTVFAVLIGVPTALYLAEFANDTVFTRTVRFAIDTLAGVPSIVYGLFGAALFVVYMKMGYSVLSGALTLAVMNLPVVVRTAEEAFRSVPREYVEAARGMGSSWFHVVRDVLLPMAKPGITAGITLSMCRAAEEAAPIILTAVMIGLISTNPFIHVLQPTDALAFRIYLIAKEYLMEPEARATAFAAATVLVAVTLGLNFLAIYMRDKFEKKIGRRG
ncbi:phosphate ABC transporter permease PstA [Methanopyrus sp.]